MLTTIIINHHVYVVVADTCDMVSRSTVDGHLVAALVLSLFLLTMVVLLARFGIGRSITTASILYLFMLCLVKSA